MKNPFEKLMASHSDEELIRIIHSPPDVYLPQALEAAKAEFQRRGLPLEEEEEILRKEIDKAIIKENSENQPLKEEIKILVILFPFLVLFFYVWIVQPGNQRRHEELFKFAGWGLLLYLGMGLIIALLLKAVF